METLVFETLRSEVFYTRVIPYGPKGHGKIASLPEVKMTPNQAKNEVELMVLSDLAAICKKIAENSAVPENLRVQAGAFVKEYDLLVPHRGKGNATVHYQAENLLIRMARFIPRILDLEPWPANSSNLPA